jgi:MFS transporter, DHA2 family, multidrug resistance protein
MTSTTTPTMTPATTASPPLTYSSAVDRTIKVSVLIAVTLITCTEYLTSYAISVALPDIQGDLAASIDEGSWILTVYSTSFLVGLVLSNWLADRFGYRRYLVGAAALFLLAAAGCGFSHTLAEMLVYRGAMGFAGGNFLARSETAIYRLFEGKARQRALMVFAVAVVGLARMAGPALGGYLTEWYTWRCIFFLNVPLILISTVLLIAFVPDVRSAVAKAMRLDVVGLLLLIGWVVSLQVMLSRGERDDWFSDPLIVTLAFIAAISLPLFIWWERRESRLGRTPLIPLAIYRSRNFCVGSIYVIILGMMLYGQLYAVPQFLRGVQHHSAFGTGQLQTFNALMFFIGLLFGAILMSKVGVRIALAMGAALFAAGMIAWTFMLTPQVSDTLMLLPLGLTGLGAGWQVGPVSTLINRDTPNSLIGGGMEMYLAQRQLGGSWGIALLAIILDRRRSLWSGRLAERLTAFNPLSQEALRSTARQFAYRGLPHASSAAAAVGLLHGRLILQSVVNAFRDTFAYQAALGIAAICLVLFFRRGERWVMTARWFVLLGR